MGGVVEELKIDNDSELRELEHEFSWATQVGRGELLPDGFVHFEDTDDDPVLVRRSAVTAIQHSGKESTTHLTLDGVRIAVRGSYEATIAKIFGQDFRAHRG